MKIWPPGFSHFTILPISFSTYSNKKLVLYICFVLKQILLSSNQECHSQVWSDLNYLLVVEVHEQPVGEDDVNGVVLDLELWRGDVGAHEGDVLVDVPIDLLVLQQHGAAADQIRSSQKSQAN